MSRNYRLHFISFLVLLSTQTIFAGRYYDSVTGRFLSVDPHSNKYPGISPYSYAANNPLKFIDPDGRDIKMFYRKPDKDAGHIILQVVDHTTGKVKATWSFGPKSSVAALSLKDVKGYQTADINAYLKENKDLLLEATIETDQQTDKRVSHNIEGRKENKEDYNLLDNNCGTTAVELINTSGTVFVETGSTLPLPSNIFQDFLDAKKKQEEQKKQEEKKEEQERQQ